MFLTSRCSNASHRYYLFPSSFLENLLSSYKREVERPIMSSFLSCAVQNDIFIPRFFCSSVLLADEQSAVWVRWQEGVDSSMISDISLPAKPEGKQANPE